MNATIHAKPHEAAAPQRPGNNHNLDRAPST
ncbi:hypothetical protein CBM2592_A120003 [Cupriavidus taiwanensis]|nr:hypothetical protein CBM2592_A120003 [Cupriavidus taiwanensis]SOY59210.1 hypothetical protein CBM2588_A90003 [Cupriavidus taiwanensis]SOY80172.1 hypothetical protein CBM2591_A140003 [Cupriavidus taiwanensis]SOZ51263.1 hypothetical protein CBM2617_A120003 [Cupriavidus taiwanensis]SOZ76225.1 hypothetical protein CBM2622_A120003 [Cupriavidus taiwanensis]